MASEPLESLGLEDLIQLVHELQERLARSEAENARLREENRQLRKELDDLKRKEKRSAAPFTKGKRKTKPKRPGRKPGQGSFRRREEPEIRAGDNVRVLEAPLPEGHSGTCPNCGGTLRIRIETASTIDVPASLPREIWRWNVEVGECGCGYCERGSHPDLPCDQHGATAHRVGPRVRSLGLTLHYHWVHFLLLRRFR